jgi:hypothetical protein
MVLISAIFAPSEIQQRAVMFYLENDPFTPQVNTGKHFEE